MGYQLHLVHMEAAEAAPTLLRSNLGVGRAGREASQSQGSQPGGLCDTASLTLLLGKHGLDEMVVPAGNGPLVSNPFQVSQGPQRLVPGPAQPSRGLRLLYCSIVSPPQHMQRDTLHRFPRPGAGVHLGTAAPAVH